MKIKGASVVNSNKYAKAEVINHRELTRERITSRRDPRRRLDLMRGTKPVAMHFFMSNTRLSPRER